MYQQYQKCRLVLENFYQHDAIDVLESLAFLENERLILCEWKMFSLKIISQFISLLPLLPSHYDQELFFQVRSTTELYELLLSFDLRDTKHVTLYESHVTILKEILSGIIITEKMKKELTIYDDIITQRASEKVKRFLDQSLEIFHEPTTVVSIVLEWFQESNLKFHKAETK